MPCLRIIVVVATLLATAPLRASPLFDDAAALDVTLEGPLGDLVADPENREQLPFVLRAEDTTHAVKVRVRGKSRLRVCDLPPLRLNFRKREVDGTVFAELDKLKLVVPCRTTGRAEDNVIEEYAIYRLFNLLTPASYRVRLLRMTFVDTARDSERTTLHTFVLEPKEMLAARLGGREPEHEAVSLSWFDAEHMALVYVFQYLIGNLDWSLVTPEEKNACCHNGTLVEAGERLLYVPYDFDLSGFVNAPYAFPPPDMRLKSVTQRRYRGFCTDRRYLEQALDTIESNRPEMNALVHALPMLSDKEKERRVGYLDQFFRAADKRDRLLGRFEKRCID